MMNPCNIMHIRHTGINTPKIQTTSSNVEALGQTTTIVYKIEGKATNITALVNTNLKLISISLKASTPTIFAKKLIIFQIVRYIFKCSVSMLLLIEEVSWL